MVGLALLVALVPAAAALEAVAFSIATTAVLVLVAGWQTVAFRCAQTGQHGESWEHEQAGEPCMP